MPADTLDARFVNGYFYTRIRPLLAARPAGQEGSAGVRAEARLQGPPRAAPAGQAGRAHAGRPSPGGRPCGPGRTTSGPPSRPRTSPCRTSTSPRLDDAAPRPPLRGHAGRAPARLPPPLHPPRLRPRPDRHPAGDLPAVGHRRAPTWCRRCRARRPRRPSRPASWPGCGPRWRPAARRRRRSTRSGPSRPRPSAELDQLPPLPRHAGVQPLRPRRRHPRRAARRGAGDDPRRARGPGHARSRGRAPRPLRGACRPPTGPSSTTC